MSALVAVVPSRTLRKWDAIAAAQLCEVAPRLAEENERLLIEAGDAWQMLDQERHINNELAERCDARIYITQDGVMGVQP